MSKALQGPSTFAFVIALMVATSGCALPGRDQAEPSGTTISTLPATAEIGTQQAQAPPPSCSASAAATVGSVAASELTEASGLVASVVSPGVLWSHNDSGSGTALFAIGAQGEDLAQIPVSAIAGIDIEDMALSDGMIYLADIGDNNSQRPGVAVYRFPEPDPSSATEITTVQSVELHYPDGAFDAEAMLVDPLSGQLVIVAKALRISAGGDSLFGPAPAPVFVADPIWDGEPVVLTQVGTVALDELAEQAVGDIPPGPIADFGLAGLATGADIRPDGAMIALRTYRTVWLFPRSDGQSVAAALAGTPCATTTVPEAQGEAVAFLTDGSSSFATVSEGLQPALNVTTVD